MEPKSKKKDTLKVPQTQPPASEGKVIRQGKKFKITRALPNDPIYQMGWIVGFTRI